MSSRASRWVAVGRPVRTFKPAGAGKRCLPWLLAAALLLAVPAGASGAGNTYTVLQCDPLNRAHDGAIQHENSDYNAVAYCGIAEQDFSMKVESIGNAIVNRFGHWRWEAPADTALVGVTVDAKLRRDAGHRSRLYMADAQGNETVRVASGGPDPTGFESYSWGGSPQRQFVASLSCIDSAGCPQSPQAKTWVRSVALRLADYSNPTFTSLGGSLLAGDWLRGSHNLSAQVADAGAGVSDVVAAVNGQQLGIERAPCQAIAGTAYATRLVPCPASSGFSRQPSTAQAPFQNGPNSLSVCVADFASNETCDVRTIYIDNAAPSLAFASAQDPDDPELIRAPVSDVNSGVASGRVYFRQVGQTLWQPLDTQIQGGELRARVDSAAEPPGQYEFMAEATDVAGNGVETTQRADGQSMVLSFPLRAGAELSANLEPSGSSRQTIPYGHDSSVAGRLVDASGEPLANQEVTVEEYFGSGALIDRRVRTVTTDSHGEWSSRLPAGPSRSVTAYFAGTPRYLSDQDEAGRLQVKSRASFRTSRARVPEGRRVVFKGKVRHFGARIPPGGKLVELQVRERAGRWNTVREAFYTGSDGRYRLKYTFGRFYQADAVFRFRLKVTREQGWPYKAPVRSRARKLTVLAR